MLIIIFNIQLEYLVFQLLLKCWQFGFRVKAGQSMARKKEALHN